MWWFDAIINHTDHNQGPKISYIDKSKNKMLSHGRFNATSWHRLSDENETMTET